MSNSSPDVSAFVNREEEARFLLIADASPRRLFIGFLFYGIVICVMSYLLGSYFLQGLVYWLFPNPGSGFLEICWWFAGTFSTFAVAVIAFIFLARAFAFAVGRRCVFLAALLGFVAGIVPGAIYLSLLTSEQISVQLRVDQFYASGELRREFVILSERARFPDDKSHIPSETELAFTVGQIVKVNELHRQLGCSNRLHFTLYVRLLVMPILCCIAAAIGAITALPNRSANDCLEES